MKRICANPECDNEALRWSDVCHAFYNSMHYHVKQGVTHLLKWGHRLKKFQWRHDRLMAAVKSEGRKNKGRAA